jgi:hypothetical protein
VFGDSWFVSVEPFSASDLFDYQVQVRNETQCIHETEPNGDFDIAESLTLGQTVHGQWNLSVTLPFTDADLWRFDVDSERLITLETDGFDSFACDTHLDTYVGPDDLGNFYQLNASDEDGGPGWLSRLQVILPPANELLGNTTADADYFVNVTSGYFIPNFPYRLLSSSAAAPAAESEPNNSCETNPDDYELGTQMLASINPGCDYDAFKFTVGALTAVQLNTGGTGDTTMQLIDCATDVVMACDDDGGAGLLSQINGCLNPGDYCIRIRAYGATSTFNYELTSTSSAGCALPGTATGDGLFRCNGFGTCPP